MTSSTLAETVSKGLKNAILRGDYLSGERLVELTLAKSLNVSQNTVRDALRMLEQEGWVVKHARRGVYVRKFTEGEAAEVFALLQSVEGLALQWALQVMTKPLLSTLSTLIESARKQADLGERQLAIEMLFRFHEQLGQIAGKRFTVHILQQLYNQVRLLEAVRQARVPRNPNEFNLHLRRHQLLYQAIERGDEAETLRLLREQVEAYGDAVVAALALV